MTAQGSYSREVLTALLVAVGLHVIVFFIFASLVVLGLLAGKEFEPDEIAISEQGEVTSLNIVFEEDITSAVLKPVVVKVPESPQSRPKFAVTQEDQDTAVPEKADFVGERDTVASSDTDAVAGEKEQVALSGKDEVKADIKTATTDFSDGTSRGAGMEAGEQGTKGLGNADVTQKEIKAPVVANEEMANRDQGTPEDFKEIDGVGETIEDKMAQKAKDPKPESDRKNKPTEEQTQPPQVAKEQGGAAGGFQTKQRKTRIRGILNAQGKGSLNVSNSALGRYEAKIFRQIERQWQTRNYQFRSHLAPGHITLRFVIDTKGRVSGQRRIEMRGASDIQWGIILNAVAASKIPPMSREVREELDGESLELSVTFNY